MRLVRLVSPPSRQSGFALNVHEQSRHRRIRAEAARTLLRLHADGALAEPERWTWEVLDRLPLWCLFDAERRRGLQLICGAVLIAPELRLWLERERIERVAQLIGEPVLDELLADADRLAATMADTASDTFSTDVVTPGPSPSEAASSPAASEPLDVEALLMAGGASVLRGTLHESLPLGALAESLGESAGELPPATAWLVLAHAERLSVSVGTGTGAAAGVAA